MNIQKALNIGMDSIVFLDDNPFERNLVRGMLPEVNVPELPEDPAMVPDYLEGLHLFEAAGYSEEDAARTAQYRAEAQRVALQQTFENRLLDMIQQQTRLRVIDSNNSDMRMEGEITGYNLSPQAVGEDAYASQTRLTISVRVKYINNKNPNLSKDQTFSAYRDFSSSEMLTDVQDELCNQISKDLADLIFNATLGDW